MNGHSRQLGSFHTLLAVDVRVITDVDGLQDLRGEGSLEIADAD